MVKIFGISNCDSVKKAISFFNMHKIEFIFYDYKKNNEIINKNTIAHWIQKVGISKLLNKRSTTYKNLDECELDKNKELCENEAILLINKHKLLIKRPIILYRENKILVGFDQNKFEKEFL